MKIILESIDIDDSEFSSWYENNRHLTKQIVLYGYNIVKYGIQDYIQKEYSEEKKLEELKQKNIEDLNREREKHSRIMNETVHMYENIIKQFKDSVNIQDIRCVLEQEYSSKMNLAVLKTTRDIESDLNDKIIKLQNEVNKYKNLYEQSSSQKELEINSKLNIAILQTEKNTETKLTQELINLKEELSKYKALYNDITYRYQSLTESENSKKIEDLLKIIDNNEKEIGLLKKTTYAKGNKGEGIIMQLLKSLYPTFEYIDASKEKHAGDIHMILPKNGETIMIESKYKENITKQDVEKFIYDIDTMSNNNKNVMCGIFVSILTKNIPCIGEMKIDFLPSPKNIPLIFVGFDNESEFEYWFRYIINLALELANKHSIINCDNDIEKKNQELMLKLLPLIDQIKSIKTTIERLRNNYMTTVNSTILDLELNVRRLFESICDITNTDNNKIYAKTVNKFICSECEQEFNSKKALAGHMKAHKKT